MQAWSTNYCYYMYVYIYIFIICKATASPDTWISTRENTVLITVYEHLQHMSKTVVTLLLVHH